LTVNAHRKKLQASSIKVNYRKGKFFIESRQEDQLSQVRNDTVEQVSFKVIENGAVL